MVIDTSYIPYTKTLTIDYKEPTKLVLHELPGLVNPFEEHQRTLNANVKMVYVESKKAWVLHKCRYARNNEIFQVEFRTINACKHFINSLMVDSGQPEITEVIIK